MILSDDQIAEIERPRKTMFWGMECDLEPKVVRQLIGGGGHKGAAGFQAKELPFALTGATP